MSAESLTSLAVQTNCTRTKSVVTLVPFCEQIQVSGADRNVSRALSTLTIKAKAISRELKHLLAVIPNPSQSTRDARAPRFDSFWSSLGADGLGRGSGMPQGPSPE